MNSYRWIAQGVTPAGVTIAPNGVVLTNLDPHHVAEAKDHILRQQYPGTVWRDIAGRPEAPGDQYMPILRTLGSTTCPPPPPCSHL